MTVEQLGLVLLIGAGVLLTSIVAVRLSHGVGLPSLLAYLGLGLLLGEDVIGIQFDNAQLAQALGLSALILILAEGGLTTSWPHVRPVVPVSVVLATVGVAVSVTLVAIAAHVLLGVDWRLAFLIGAILSSTDAAAVFSVLRALVLPHRVAGTLEAESGFNDAPVVILVMLLSATDEAGAGPLALVGTMAYELVVGALVGLAVGRIGALGLRSIALPASGLYPIAVLAFTIGAYGTATVLHASGFLAVYLAALVLGNSGLPHGPATRSFAEGAAWLAQIGVFVMLGLLADPSRLPGQVLPALVIGFILLLVARPVSVVASAIWFRLRLREQAFLSWAGLRGAVPVILATVPLSMGTPESSRLFDLVFVLVVIFTLLQGPTLPFAARRLGLTGVTEARDLNVEAAPLETLHADLLQLRIPDDSRLHGVEIFELRLPRGASPTLIVREERSFVPNPSTVLVHGDELLIVVTHEAREETERRLRAVSRAGKLAGWFGERGD